MPLSKVIGFSEKERKELHEFWNSRTCGELVKGQDVKIIPAEATLVDACELLIDNQILSALVRKPEGDGFAGVFSYRSILKHFIDVYDSEAKIPHSSSAFLKELMYNAEGDSSSSLFLKEVMSAELGANPQRLEEANAEANRITRDSSSKSLDPLNCAESLTAAAYVTTENKPVMVVKHTDPLLAAVRILASGIHRISVLDDAGNALGVLSQSSVVYLLADHLDQLNKLLDKSVHDLDLGKDSVLYIYRDQKVIEAMIIMYKTNLSGLAVVDNSNKIVGNISMSDVKHIFKEQNHRLFWSSCESFLKHIRTQSILHDHQGMVSFDLPVSPSCKQLRFLT
mmetsp:Transcript_11094/g.27992  ORF Transcript_11094/g.27992 Transcript_11094/m.27992 type:complete len:339 (+) Transcript_11094:96-1112(+)